MRGAPGESTQQGRSVMTLVLTVDFGCVFASQLMPP
jgi:hypothetical protein